MFNLQRSPCRLQASKTTHIKKKHSLLKAPSSIIILYALNHYEYPLNSDVEEPIQGVLNFSELGNDARLIVPNNAKRKELLTDPQSSLRIVGVNSRSSNLPTSMTLRSKDYQSKTSYKTSLFHENSTSTTSSGGVSRAVTKRGNDEDYSAKPLRLAASTD